MIPLRVKIWISMRRFKVICTSFILALFTPSSRKKMIDEQLEEKIKSNCMLPTDFKALYEHEKFNPWAKSINKDREKTGKTQLGRTRNYGQTSTFGTTFLGDSSSV